MWTRAWPLYSRIARRQRLDRVVRDGQDDQLDFVEHRRDFLERPGPADELPEPLAPNRVAAGDGADRPAGPGQGEAEPRADGAGSDDPDDRRLTGRRAAMRMGVVVRLTIPVVVVEVVRHTVRMVVVPARRGVEVNARLAQRGQLLGVALLLRITLAPGPHRSGYASIR